MRSTVKVEMVGKKFGEILVLKENKDRNKHGHITYHCLCSCGNTKNILGASLRQGLTKSCGCAHISKITKHGMDGTPIYRAWTSMRDRCNNPNNYAYAQYGGRGIKVCERWEESFMNFYNDMGERPKGLSLDRIDVNGNYCKENCRWATAKEQQENRRISIFVLIDGDKLTPSQYANTVGLTLSGANKKIRREFKRVGNVFIKESNPAYKEALEKLGKV